MNPLTHQTDISKRAYSILKKHMMVYLAMEERTGKTLTAILTAEQCGEAIQNILVLTKKQAIKGWTDTLAQFKHNKNYLVTNYHQACKLSQANFDLVILDEAHSYLSAYPKPSATCEIVKSLTDPIEVRHIETNKKMNVRNLVTIRDKSKVRVTHINPKPIIYLSATPSSNSLSLIFHQFILSAWSPFGDMTFYEWHAKYGIPATKYFGGRQAKDYSKVNSDEVEGLYKHLFISYTRKELGFKFEPEDKIHHITLNDFTTSLYNKIMRDNIATYNDIDIVCEASVSQLTKLHQIEGGTIKTDETSITLPNTEKIDYIKQTWGDTDQVVIFYHYKQEELKLKAHFKNAHILQAVSFAEGVDLSMYETLIIYSMNFSTAQYTQRRARQANYYRDKPIIVHYLLVKDGISEQVYNCVAKNKRNFVDRYFNRCEL